MVSLTWLLSGVQNPVFCIILLKCSLGTPGSTLFSLVEQTRCTVAVFRGCRMCEDVTQMAAGMCAGMFFQVTSFSFVRR